MSSIVEFIRKIREARLGKDVRESIAKAIEQTYEDASKSGSSNMEVSEARGEFETLSKRLNNSDRLKADKNTVEWEKEDRKREDNNLQSQINGLASGSPLVASSVSEMTDTSRVYVNAIDGHWYYYNGNTWIDGGVYQAMGIETEVQENINGNTFLTNLFNNSNQIFNHNGRYTINTGIYVGGGNYYTTDLLKLDSIKNIKIKYPFFSNSTNKVSLFNEIKEYIGNSEITDISQLIENYPLAKYARFSIFKEYLPNLIIENNLLNLSKKPIIEIPYETTIEDWEQGGLANGQKIDSSTRIRTPEVIELQYDKKYSVKINNDYIGFIHFIDYDGTGYYGQYLGPFSGNISFTAPCLYCLIAVKKRDDSIILPSESSLIGLKITKYDESEDDVIGKSYVDDKIQDIIEKINQKNSRWYGKKINVLGDSITYGLGLTKETKKWGDIVGEKLGASIVRNYGISNSTIANYNSLELQDPMCLRYTEMDDDADLIIVLAGRNDYRSLPVPIGKKDDIGNDTFYGGVKTLLSGLWNKYPTKTIVFCTMFKALCENDELLRDNEWKNYAGNIQEDYNNVIKEVCKDYSIPVIDLYNEGIFNSWNPSSKSAWFSDTVHPNEEGQRILGEIISSRLRYL